jgi:hypothetical protein
VPTISCFDVSDAGMGDGSATFMEPGVQGAGQSAANDYEAVPPSFSKNSKPGCEGLLKDILVLTSTATCCMLHLKMYVMFCKVFPTLQYVIMLECRPFEQSGGLQRMDDQPGKPLGTVGGSSKPHGPAGVDIIASARAPDSAPPPAFLPLHKPAPAQTAVQSPHWSAQLPSQQHGPSSNNIGALPGSPGSSRVTPWDSTATAGSRLQAATDTAVLSHHAAAINASLAAAGSRLAGASSRAAFGAPAQQQPAAWRPQSIGGTTVTESMHSATSGRSRGDGNEGPSNFMPLGARCEPSHSDAIHSTAGSEATDQPLLDAGPVSMTNSVSNGVAKVSHMLDSTWHAMNRYAGR